MGTCIPLSTTILCYLVIVVSLFNSSSQTNLTCDTVNITNGAVFRTHESNLENYIKFECIASYYLEGSNSLNCSTNTVLTTSMLPKCILKQSCNAFTISNGVLSSSSSSASSSSSWVPNTVIFIKCNEGYILTTSYTSVKCLNNGTWDNILPYCQTQGEGCILNDGWLQSKFISTNSSGLIPYGQIIKAECIHGYYSKSVGNNFTCINGQWYPNLETQCLYIGFAGSISNGTDNVTTSILTYDKGVSLILTCDVRSNSSDGLPLPQVTWVYPTKLKDYVDKTHSSGIHSAYIDSIRPSYSTIYNEDNAMYYARGVLAINTTMDVHRGVFSCQIRLVDETEDYQVTIAIRSKYVVAMWCLIIIPVVLCMAIHCFYRNASNMSPFPANRLTKHMLQEHEKKKKLDEMKNVQYKSPLDQKTDQKIHRGRRGAVVEP